MGEKGFEPLILAELVPKTSVYTVPPLARVSSRNRTESIIPRRVPDTWLGILTR